MFVSKGVYGKNIENVADVADVANVENVENVVKFVRPRIENMELSNMKLWRLSWASAFLAATL